MIGLIILILLIIGVLLIPYLLMEQKKSKISAKLFFMHLLSMLTLYASAIAFITVIYQIVNLTLPDPLIIDSFRDANFFKETLRGALSFLIIMFPVYVWTLHYLKKFYKKAPHQVHTSARKFLVYLTMFAAGVTILFSLVFLVNRLLDGELTLNFALKLLSIFFVTGSVFGYYTLENKQYA